MLNKIRQSKKIEGFTIIEVMIVLAIAGVIMGIVFIAIPASQRGSRNEQRNADASRYIAAIGECLGNKNGQVAQCSTAALVSAFVDTTRNQQLATVTWAAGAPGDTATLNVAFNQNCDAAGAGIGANPTPRQYSALYRIETQSGNTPRCIGG